MQQNGKKDNYIGYVGDRKEFDSGVVKYSISFKEAQLDEMKKYLTSAGNVNIDFVMKTDGTAFTSVYNPRANGTNAPSRANQTVAQGKDDLPF
jgi:hypothetical protein